MKTALLVIDMQKFFGDMLDPPMPQIGRLVDFFKKTDRLVIFTQHGHTPEELIPPIKNQLIVNEDWELAPKIWKMTGDAPVIGKNTYDAFMHTSLEAELKNHGVERVLISGVMSDICCNTTARSAFVRGYETLYISDACWSENVERHLRAVDDMRNVISRVLRTADAINALGEEASLS